MMLSRFISYAERTDISVSRFIFGFAGVMFVRFFLESVSSPVSSGIFAIDAPTLVHYTLFYLSTFLALVLIVGSFAGDIKRVGKIFFVSLPILWLSPIADLILTRGHGVMMAYIFDAPIELVKDFFLFFGPRLSGGITLGIRAEVFLMIVFIFWYIHRVRGGFIRPLFAMISAYACIFFFCALPSIVYAVASLSPVVGGEGVNAFWIMTLDHSVIAFNSLNGNFSYVNSLSFMNMSFDKAISEILVLIGFLLFVVWYFAVEAKKASVFLKNSRPERIFFYLLLLVYGVILGARVSGPHLFSWIDFCGFLSLCVSIVAAWVCAVCVNDIEDLPIDSISNKQRPLPKGDLDAGSMRSAAAVFFLISLFSAWAVGYYQLFSMIVFSALYYVYSAFPFRLKQIPIFSSFLISLVCLVTVFTGFFFVCPQKSFGSFPFLVAIGIVIMCTLAVNIRDLKDYSGDSATGVWTIPVLLGPINGSRIVGVMFALAFFAAPYFFSLLQLYFLAIPFGLSGYYLANRKPYNEQYLFALSLIYLVLIDAFYLL